MAQECSLSWLLVCKWFVQTNYYYISFETVEPVPSNDTIHNPSEHHYHTYPVYCITKWSTGWQTMVFRMSPFFKYKDMTDRQLPCNWGALLIYSGFFEGEKKRALRVCQLVIIIIIIVIDYYHHHHHHHHHHQNHHHHHLWKLASVTAASAQKKVYRLAKWEKIASTVTGFYCM